MENKVAIIDLGTNTFHLLMAEVKDGSFEIFHKEKVPVKIGEGGINESYITQEAHQRAINTILKFKTKIENSGITKIKITATSAIRNAKNRDNLIKDINELIGEKINVLSGDEEADFIYYGVKEALDLGKIPALIMDIGGGSVEFIICEENDVFWKKSFEIGAQRVMDKFHKNDPITAEEIEAINAFFQATLGELISSLDKYNPQVLIGSSGTFETLSEIFINKNSIEKPIGTELPFDLRGFADIYNEIISRNRVERLSMKGMLEMRVDMIVIACILIHFVLSNHKFKTIRVSSYALKEGVLAELLQSEKTLD